MDGILTDEINRLQEENRIMREALTAIVDDRQAWGYANAQQFPDFQLIMYAHKPEIMLEDIARHALSQIEPDPETS